MTFIAKYQYRATCLRIVFLLSALIPAVGVAGPDSPGLKRKNDVVTAPRIDTRFAYLALDFLDTGNRDLLREIAETGGARHIAAHARRVSLTGEAPDARQLVEQILTSASLADSDTDALRARLAAFEADKKAQRRCWREAAAYLPEGALADATLFLTVGYDIGVAVDGNASVNVAHPHFAGKPEELWFYSVHELHHAGFQKFNRLPQLSAIKTTGQLAELIRYLTAMEGQAVHAAWRWRAEAGALQSDSDYVALLDSTRMNVYEPEFFTAYQTLAATKSRLLKESDWAILEKMSTGDRLWYRVGARMAKRIEKELGWDILVGTVREGPESFFARYAELAQREAAADSRAK